MKRKRYLIVLCCVAMVLSMLTGCGAVSDPATEPAVAATAEETYHVLNYGVDAEPASVDCLFAYNNAQEALSSSVMEHLWDINHNGEYVYRLATGFEIAEDNSSMTIHCREGVTFQDGTPFTADDVLFSLERVKANAQYSARVSCVDFDKTHVEDDYTIVVAFSQFDATFPSSLSASANYIVSRKWYSENGEDVTGTQLNGTGPYVLDEWNMGTSFHLVRNENYWGDKPYYDEINIKFFAEESTRMMEYEVGNLDIAYITSATEINLVDTGYYENTSLVKVGLQYPGGFKFNLCGCADQWPLALRKAVAHAIDVDSVVSGVCNGLYNAGSSCLPSTSWAYKNEGAYEYDPELSKQLLAEAGLTDVTFDIYQRKTGMTMAIAEAIQSQLKEVGITMNINEVDPSTWNQMNANSENPAAVWGSMGAGDPADVLMTWESGSTSIYRAPDENDRLQEILVEAKATADESARKALYEEFQDIVHDNYYTVPIYEQNYFFAVRDGILADVDTCFNRSGNMYPRNISE